MRHISIIPARSGSKGIKDKNIKPLLGQPLLQYSVQAALDSEIFDCVHVSTDSEQYADLARKCGAEVPFLRDKEFSTDSADSWNVVRFVLEQYKNIGQDFDLVTLLQPTSPLRNAEDIRSAYHIFCEKKAESVVSISETAHSPLLTNIVDESLSLNGFINLKEIGRRQDMPKYYCINGAIYMIKTSLLDRITDLYGENSFGYIMPKTRSIDIDSMLDFRMVEIILEEGLDSAEE